MTAAEQSPINLTARIGNMMASSSVVRARALFELLVRESPK